MNKFRFQAIVGFLASLWDSQPSLGREVDTYCRSEGVDPYLLTKKPQETPTPVSAMQQAPKAESEISRSHAS